ncbi:putative nuclease HARBI1 [Pseudophryne corroboree]|uniref:putative nuclease HARBI1 n=1 Tax=Pseudophryne corroboree TaxID=495146 RepID=UPI003081E816
MYAMHDRARVAVALAMVALVLDQRSKRRRRRRCRAKEQLRRRRGPQGPLRRGIRDNNPDDFRVALGLTDPAFQELLQLVTPFAKMQNHDARLPSVVSAEQRLAATLRFLAAGRSLEDIKSSTDISVQDLGDIIPETCEAIIQALEGEYLKFPSTCEEWQEIAHNFEEKFHFPNCGGAIGGKHVRIMPPATSGSYFCNYSGFSSILLTAIVNANSEFIFVDVGTNDGVSVGGALEQTVLYHKLQNGSLNLPSVRQTKHGLNFVFVASDAFALHLNVLKPFPQSVLTPERRVFNDRLSRARRAVENAFGILSNRFRIFSTSIMMHPDKIDKVVVACCVLHNYLRRQQQSGSHAAAEDCVDGLRWTPPEIDESGNPTGHAKVNRDSYVNYFNGPGVVGRQDNIAL